jgi:hypothetical protein
MEPLIKEEEKEVSDEEPVEEEQPRGLMARRQ